MLSFPVRRCGDFCSSPVYFPFASTVNQSKGGRCYAKKTRSVGSKQNLMSDSKALPSPTTNNLNKPRLSSHLLLRSFSSKVFADNDAIMRSPTSILETKHLSSFTSLLHSDAQPKRPLDAASYFPSTKEPIGLGIVDALNEDKVKEEANPERRMVLLGSQLKIQIPSLCSPTELPNSPIEFGIKNRDSQLAMFCSPRRSSVHEEHHASPPWIFTGAVSMSEMELSEDYTCVISHGPNPKTTHIFDNCIMECCSAEFLPMARKESGSTKSHDGYPSDDYACKKILGQQTDIFIYRGEKEFCSSECRSKEILVDEE